MNLSSQTLQNSSQKAQKALLAEKVSQFLNQPNAHLLGNSFDASHLSSFLLNSKFSQPAFSHKPISGSAIGSSYLSQKSFSEKPSSFFISPDRAKKTLDFPSNYSNLNPLVLPNFSKKAEFLEKNEKIRENYEKNRENMEKNIEKNRENPKKNSEKSC